MSWSAIASATPDGDAFTAVSTATADRMPGRELIDAIVAAERLIGHLQAAQLTAIAELARPGRAVPVDSMLDLLRDTMGPADDRDPAVVTAHLEDLGRGLAASEIAAALHQSHVGASARVAVAVELVRELPATLAAVADGRIDIARARTIADRTRLLDRDNRRRVEAAVLPLAQTRTPGQLNPMIDRRVIAVDPAAAHKRTIAARRDRSVDHRPAADGMGDIHAHLPAEAALDVYHLLDQLAVATAGQDNRPATARRADALTDLCTALLTDGHVDVTGLLDPAARVDPAACVSAPHSASASGTATADAPPPRSPRMPGSHHGRPVHLNLTMSLEAFAGLSRDPAVLAGHGTITADLAAAIARSLSTLSVHLTDCNGFISAVGATSTYTPCRPMTDHVLAAAGTCRLPSCRMPAYRCDLDHRTPYDHAHPDEGGSTSADNLDPLCRHHHRLKTHCRWAARRDPADGLTMIWTSPTGHIYPQHPATADVVAASEMSGTTTRPQPQDLDHVDDPPAPAHDPDHTCHSCLACAATGPSIAVRTLDMLESRAAATVERHRNRRRPALLSPHATWTYRIGLNSSDHRDDTDDDEDNYDIQSDLSYQPPTDAFLRRFCSEHYQHLQQQRFAAAHPDADAPSF